MNEPRHVFLSFMGDNHKETQRHNQRCSRCVNKPRHAF